jgi:acyl-CoA thioesterase-1
MLRILLASLMFSCASPALANGGGAAPVSKPAPTILIFGDSLSAGHGLANGQSWPSLLGQRLQAENSPYTVVNASISGETTAGGRTRLPAALERTKPAVVIIALGANDGLRGLPVKQLKENLVAMARVSKGAKARVLLVGMRLPPNYGAAYTEEFDRAFATVAKQEKLPLLPFLLEPVAADRANFQPDGLHPVAATQSKILDHVWPALKPLLR